MEHSDMKIGCWRYSNFPHSKPFFVVVSNFEMNNFPVRVRCLRLGQTRVANIRRASAALNGEESRKANGRGR
jgi:hypothetical protein